MKQLVTLFTLAAFGFGLPANLLAAEKKAAAEKSTEVTKKAAEKPAAAVNEAPAKVAGEAKSIPMHVRADAVDAKAKTFTMKRKDGVEVKHLVTDSTTIMNEEAPAKFEDIKIGDYVSGLRKKNSNTEYEVVKITKLGAAPEKKPKADAAKPEEEKKKAN